MKKFLCLLVLIVGCHSPTPEEVKQYKIRSWENNLPKGATNIDPISERWATFEYNDTKILVYYNVVNSVPVLEMIRID